MSLKVTAMTDQTFYSQTTVACAKCAYQNAPGVRFCAQCGQSPLEIPASPQPTIGISMNTGSLRTVNVALGADDAYNRMASAIASNKGRITGSQQGSGGTFSVDHSGVWTTLMTKVKFDGEFSVRGAGNGGSAISFSLKLDFNSLVSLIGITMACAVMLIVWWGIGAGIFVLAVSVANLAYVLWQLNGQASAKILDSIANQLQYSGPTQAPKAAYTPQPAASATPAPAPVAPAHDDVIARLKSLATLRDIGAVTAEEFETKKAELLARL